MIYIVYCFLIIVFAYFGDKRRKGIILRMMPMLFFIIIVGFRRYNVGVDSETYMELYYRLPNENYRWIEIGFDWLIRMLDKYGFEYNGLYLVCVTITAIPIFLTLEKTSHYFVSAIMMYIFLLPSVTNGMRQCISVGMFFYGVTFIQERKLMPFLICIAVATLFHYSSIILVPLYFFLNKAMRKEIFVTIYLVSFIFCFMDVTLIIRPLTSLISGLGRDYYAHFDSYVRGELSILGFLYNTAVNVMIFFLIIKSKANEKYPTLSNGCLIVFVLKNMSLNFPMVGRISLYFAWLPYLLLPYLICECFNKKTYQLAVTFFVLLMSVGFVNSIVGGEMRMLPYEFSFKLMR